MTKYRHGVLTGEHLGTLGEVFASVCVDSGAELVEMDGEDDHVHLLVTYPPRVAVARPVNTLRASPLGGCASVTGWVPTRSTCGSRSPTCVRQPRVRVQPKARSAPGM